MKTQGAIRRYFSTPGLKRWMLVVLISPILPAIWDAYRVHSFGWVGHYQNTQANLDRTAAAGKPIPEMNQPVANGSFCEVIDPIANFETFSTRVYLPVEAGSKETGSGKTGSVKAGSGDVVPMDISVGMHTRKYVGLGYEDAHGFVVGRMDEPIQYELETISIGYVKQIIRWDPSLPPRFELIESPYPDAIVAEIDRMYRQLNRVSFQSGVRVGAGPMIRHDGVMEPRVVYGLEGEPTLIAGKLQYTPPHAFSYYRVTHGSPTSPMTWDRFFMKMWQAMKYILLVLIGAYVIGYIGYLFLYPDRRRLERMKQGLCIKCAYPMQEDRAGKSMICTECGYLDHVDTLNA